MATMTEEKDKRISELQVCKDQDIWYLSENKYFDIIANKLILLQEHNNDLFNKLEEFEERYNNQLDVSRWDFLSLLQIFFPLHIKNLQLKTCNM